MACPGGSSPRGAAEEMLEAMSAAYAQKVQAGCELTVNISVDGERTWHVTTREGRTTWGPGFLSGVDTVFTLSREALAKLFTGEWAGLTAAGRAGIRDPAPLDFTIPDGVSPLQAMRSGYFFITHFFSTETPTRIRFGPGHTRKIHGGQATPLFYHPGLRSAYYRVTPADRLNEDGARDPLHQAFIVIGGRGWATVGDRRFPVAAGEAIYIEPNSIHLLETEGPDDLEIIWLAWGDGA